MKPYNHKIIESKWQKQWEKSGIYEANSTDSRKKFYALIEFPYPSGDGLHVGHIRSNTAMDIIARKRRAEGFNVLYPIGWDAFGLPTENYAIKMGIQPKVVTKKNTDNFRRQLKSVGFSFDWKREINTTDPNYYRWTQWIFLQLLKKNLAYKTKMPINWCLSCKIGLANEEVVGGMCERCGGATEKREKEQWMLAITKYADRLHKDLDDVDYLEKIKIQQRNWIGRSEGVEIDFKLTDVPEQDDGKHSVKVFTTRPDTLFGATFLAVSAELAQKWIDVGWNVNDDVRTYIKKTTIENTKRGFDEKEKTGVFSGIYAINPANEEKIPVWVVNYVLGDVGTGAIMAVPAHDERDFGFAKKFNLPILCVIRPYSEDIGVRSPGEISLKDTELKGKEYVEKILAGKECYDGLGMLINSGKFDRMVSESAKEAITEFVGGKKTVRYKLRDWVFSRQRYWGEPIPVVHCPKCGIVPVPKKELPVLLPAVKSYKPTDTGESPLAKITKWVNTKCPTCKSPAKRETDTMPNWAGSSWYYLRYVDPKNKKVFADKKYLKHWLPVDWYNGGMEHTTLHLLYSRFWHKFLYDISEVPTHEPYQKRTAHGLIIAKGGVKMSKSKGNVVNPDDIVATYGADTLRLYEMFMGPFDQSVEWSTESIIGPRRFIERVWRLREKVSPSGGGDVSVVLNQTVKKVSEDIESISFNTAVSQMMILVNAMERVGDITQRDFEVFLRILAPFAPHVAEELWQTLGHKKSIHLELWPTWEEGKIKEESVTIMVQVNGKIRGSFSASPELSEKDAQERALQEEGVRKWMEGREIKKVIYVKGRLINIVI